MKFDVHARREQLFTYSFIVIFTYIDLIKSLHIMHVQGEVLATVIKCSSQGRSCTLQLQDTEVHINCDINELLVPILRLQAHVR